jgi:uncharacterized membrane protein
MIEDSRNKPRWCRVTLSASVVLNLFLAALIVGHLWRSHQDGLGSRAPIARILANIESKLSPQDAATFHAVMTRGEPRVSQSAQQLAETRRELLHQLTANPFDEQAAKRALSTWHTSGDRFLDDFGDTLIDALAQVSPEGRRRIAAERQKN